jgi:hypothetical protein
MKWLVPALLGLIFLALIVSLGFVLAAGFDG